MSSGQDGRFKLVRRNDKALLLVVGNFGRREGRQHGDSLQKHIVNQAASKCVKVTKSRGSFPSDEALLKLFYLALNNISKKWTMPHRDWKAALTRFTIQFEGRMPKD